MRDECLGVYPGTFQGLLEDIVMGYASFVVHVDQAVYTESLMEVALRLAVAYDAHLTALHTYTPSYYVAGGYTNVPAWGTVEAALRAEENEIRQHDSDFKAIFESQVRQFRAAKTQWSYKRGELVPIVAAHARCADMVLMRQRDADDVAGMGVFDAPAQVALLSGRPVLVVPYAGHFDVVGKRIAIAWKSTREATRAVAAALPLLSRADSVDILIVGEEEHAGVLRDDSPGADVTLYLAHHGIKSSLSHIPRGDIRISDALLSSIADRDIDLLCMGAYGHSRWRQLVLGGVTRDLMCHMTVPTLIAG